MSYDFYIGVDTGGEEEHYVEPYFDDTLPEFGHDGMAGTAVATSTGYARCGNYTSNVSGMWTRCLTAAAQDIPEARGWAGDDARAFNASGRTCSYRRDDGELLRDVPRPVDVENVRLRDLEGKLAEGLVPLLRAAVRWGIDHIDELREMNPENGWGNAEGAVTYLWDIQRMCEAHPKGRLRISS